MNKKTISISFAENTIKQAEELREKWGMFSLVETIRKCISFTYEKENPAYIPAMKRKPLLSPVEKAQQLEDVKFSREELKKQKEQQEKERKENEGADILRQLGGEEYKDEKGFRKGKYKSYIYLNSKNCQEYENDVYLEDLIKEDLEKQYWNDITKEREEPIRVMESFKYCQEALNKGAKKKKKA
jgi:hypothetical protein